MQILFVEIGLINWYAVLLLKKIMLLKNISAAIAVANILPLLSSDTYAYQLDTIFSLRHFGHLSCNNILNSL